MISYKWVVTGLLCVAAFLNLEDRVVIFSVLPLIKQDLKPSPWELSMIMPAFLWIYAAFSPFAGYAGDRWPRKRILIWCLFWWSVITMITGLVQSPTQLLGLRAVLGISQAFYIPVSYAILADCHTQETRGRASAALHIGAGIGPIVGGALAGWLGEHYGWRPTLILLGGAGVALALLCQIVMKGHDTAVKEEKVQASAGETALWILKTPTFLCLIATSGFTAVAVWMLITWLPIFLFDTFGMKLSESALLGNLAISGPNIPGFLLGGFLSDVLARHVPKRRLLMVAIPFALAIPWPVAFWLASGAGPILLSASAFLLCRAIGDSNWHPVMFDVVPAEKRATAVGIANSFNTAMGGMGAFAAGLWKDTFGLQAIFAFVAILIAIAAGLLFLSYAAFFERDRQRAAA